MQRREFITLSVGAALALPHNARAQEPMPVIGLLASASPDQWVERLNAFRRGLADSGYVEGKNVTIEYRWADGRNERLPALATELVVRRVAVLVALGNTPSVQALKAATTTIPIVFRVAIDPVAIGLVASLGRPGGNLTGVTTLGVEVGPKQLQLLYQLVPSAKAIALLVNPTNPTLADVQLRTLAAAARNFGIELPVLKASSDREFEGAFDTLARLRAGGLVIGVDAFFNSRNELLADFAIRRAVPTASAYREFTVAGGLMSYGGSVSDASRLAGAYAGRILKGSKPSDLPVQQVAKLELVINLKTAKALGIVIPPNLLASADEVIE